MGLGTSVINFIFTVKANISEKEKKWYKNNSDKNPKWIREVTQGRGTRERVASEMKSFPITVEPLGATLGTKATVPWIEMSRPWMEVNVRLGFLNNQPTNKILFCFSVFCLGICCSHSKIMSKKSWLTYFSAILCVELPQVQYIDLSEIVLVVKTVVTVTSVHLNLLILFVASNF